MTITPIQGCLIVIAVLGVLSGATAQLTDLFGPKLAEGISTSASLVSSIISAVLMPLTGQSATIKSVAAMPGVESIKVNASANQTLASLAVSNESVAAKIEATPAAEATVAAIAKGA